MLHFLKQKPLLRDLIPENHIDIHSHLLPGIDDGAPTISESISLINQMNAVGFKNIITTPHIITNIWENTETSIQNVHQETLKGIKGNCSFSSFNVAAEYMIDSYFLKKLETQKLLTLKDNYILVELSYLNAPINLYEILFEIQLAGYIPILAHPERYLFYHSNLKEYNKLKNAGCLFQLNLLATVDYYSTGIRKIAERLLADGYYDFVGSDIHHQNHVNSFSNKVTVKNVDQLNKVIQENLFFLE